MKKPCPRPKKEARTKKRKMLYAELRQRQAEQGLKVPKKATPSNSKSEYQTVEEEQSGRQMAAEGQLKSFRAILPTLLIRLSKIEDPRNPKRIKHKLSVILLYGLLTFVLQMASRREANREMSMACFTKNLRLLFPELETLPHNDTLNRLLCDIEVDKIEITLIEVVDKLIRNKKFRRYLVGHHYLIAIDGTQKFKRDYPWTDECLKRHVSGQAIENYYYYVYVLEATLVFPNGITIPFMTEFLEYTETELLETKQDCELNAFKRLAACLKQYFPRLSIMLLLDGLYPNGPLMALCRQYHWQFMIVLQDKSLPSVWKEAEGLRKLQSGQTLDQTWGDRKQHFWWVNDIEYYYGKNERQKQIVHLVVCEEVWEEVDLKSNVIVTKNSRHAWISSHPLTCNNLHYRCNLAARHRWGIEHNILIEKHHGYQYEHCFSYDWDAMKGYHYLMRLAHLLNTLAHNSVYLIEMVRKKGVQGLVKYMKTTLSGPWLNAERIHALLMVTPQLRLE